MPGPGGGWSGMGPSWASSQSVDYRHTQLNKKLHIQKVRKNYVKIAKNIKRLMVVSKNKSNLIEHKVDNFTFFTLNL